MNVLQLSRAPGFKLQTLSRVTNGLEAVSVARPGRWGNPQLVGKHGDAAACIAQFRAELVSSPTKVAEAQRDLNGQNLACWCKPGKPCHADVLIEIANSVRSG
jgi:hypothetical protein